MQLPLHDTYLFIGFPVMIGLAINTFYKYKKTKNQTSLFIAIGSMCLAISLFFTGFPSLFIKDPKALGYFAFIADIFQSLLLYTIWLLAIKIYLSKNTILKYLGYFATTVLLIASILEAATRNLNPPYGIVLSKLSNISYDIIITETPIYRLLLGLEYLPMILVGIYFWRSSFSSSFRSQRIRVQGLSIAFVIGSLLFITIPTIPINPYLDIKDIAVSLVYLTIGVSMLMGYFLNKRKTQQIIN